MKVREFLKQFGNYSEAMLDKDIVIEAPNGLLFEPKIKQKRKTEYPVNFKLENLECYVITP